MGSSLQLVIMLVTPALRPNIRPDTNPNPPRPSIAPRTPGPAGAAGNREMVPAETEPGGGDTDQAAEDHVEAVVAVVGEAGADDVDGGADGDEDEDESVDGGRGGLVADGYDVFLGKGGRDGFFGVAWEQGGACAAEVRSRSDGRGMGGVCAKRSRWKERNGNRKLGCEEKGQIQKSCPGNYFPLVKCEMQSSKLGLQLECPLGNDLNPSCKISSSVCVQIFEVTKTHLGSNSCPALLTTTEPKSVELSRL